MHLMMIHLRSIHPNITTANHFLIKIPLAVNIWHKYHTNYVLRVVGPGHVKGRGTRALVVGEAGHVGNNVSAKYPRRIE